MKKKCDPINVLEFNTALNFMKPLPFEAASTIFEKSRNRLAFYIMFFSGIKVGALKFINYNFLEKIFGKLDNNETKIKLEKKRKYDEQKLLVSKGVRDFYCFKTLI